MNIKLLLASSCLVIQASSTKSTSSNSETSNPKKKSPCCFSRRFVAVTALIAAISALTLVPKDSWSTKLTNVPIEEETNPNPLLINDQMNTEEHGTEYIDAVYDNSYNQPQSDELQKIQKVIKVEQSEESVKPLPRKSLKLSEITGSTKLGMCQERFRDYSKRCSNFNPIETFQKEANEKYDQEFEDEMIKSWIEISKEEHVANTPEFCYWYSKMSMRDCSLLLSEVYSHNFPETIDFVIENSNLLK